ncbi:MAG: hypothetical protein AAF740_14000, partial [Bacteroidota bacterium]
MIRLLLITAFFMTSLTGHAQSLEDQLSGKRWGLEHMIQPYFEQQIDDTLFSTIDCKGEFLELKEDGTYQWQAQEKSFSGTWSVNKDSLISLNKKNGKLRSPLQITRLSNDQLVVVELYKGQRFIYDFFLCTESNKNRLEDTRETFNETRFTGISAGVQFFDRIDNGVELGFVFGKRAWNDFFWATGPSLELAPWNDLYGLSWGFWSSKGIATSFHATAYTDGTDVNFGIEPGIGFGLPFLGERGRYMQVVYS